MTIGDKWLAVNGRPSGFDYLRVTLAASVAIWHSYQVAYGTDAALLLWQTSILGLFLQLILPMFFALSGFLVAGSMYRNPDLRKFLTLRAVRIYPALVVEVVMVALILGPIVTVTPLGEYFTDRKFTHYLLNMFGYIHFVLPGVFLSNPYPEIINSQLWTVPYELECYLLIAGIFLLEFFRATRRVLPIFLLMTVAVVLWNYANDAFAAPPGGFSGRVLLLCFLGGVVLYAMKDRIPLRADLAVVALLATMLLPRVHDALTYLVPICAAYATVYIGLWNPRRTIIINSGDYSYGVYLYSNPIEQTVQQALGYHASFLQNVAVSLPITIAFALFSWWCVEKPFMKVKRLILARPIEGHTERAPGGEVTAP